LNLLRYVADGGDQTEVVINPIQVALVRASAVHGFSHAEILFSGGLKVTVMADVETVLRELATALSRA
jgi:hypothetical protein